MRRPQILEQYLPDIDARLAQLLPTGDSHLSRLHAAMRYSLLAPGKRLRPALCMAAAHAVSGDAYLCLDAGCAIEMVHAFSLIHDDLPAIDNDDLRRGRNTCHIEFGEATAILAGDALFALAFEVVASLKAPAERVVQAVVRLTQAVGSEGLVGGEIVDVLSEGEVPTADIVEFIHARKTGALIAASCSIGALLAGAEPETIEAFHRFGASVGLAFQIADDVLNETSTAEALGKSVGSDRERVKATYPAVYGVAASQAMAVKAAEAGIEHLSAMGSAADPLRELARFSVHRLS